MFKKGTIYNLLLSSFYLDRVFVNLFLNADLELKNNLRNINDNDNICHGLAEI